MRLGELFGRAGLSYPPETESIEIKNIVTDSRAVSKGSLFICLRGMTDDGHEYIDSAINAGASVIVAEQLRGVCVGGAAAYIMHDNTRQVAALLYNSRYGNPTEKLKIIGVTGTNGKTSVAAMLYEIFTAAGKRCGLIGTVCRLTADGRAISRKKKNPLANMTTPDPEELYDDLAKMVKDRVEYVFMEVSSHALALCKTDAIRFDSAVFTNLTRDHLDFHGSMEEYYNAKKKLFTVCNQGFINTDGEFGKRLADECFCPFFTVSADRGDFCAIDIKSHGLGGSEYRLKYPEGYGEISLPLLGEFQVENSLMAAAVALSYGIPFDVISKTLANIRGVKGRMERVDLHRADFSVIIDYAHTPDALEKLMHAVRKLRPEGGNITLVFGCGGERDREKRKEMAQIASRLADFVIITSDNSRSEDPQQIFKDILKGIDKERPYALIESRREAIESAVLTAKSRDIVVLAGKGHEKYEIDAKGKHPFDETKIVRSAAKTRCD